MYAFGNILSPHTPIVLAATRLVCPRSSLLNATPRGSSTYGCESCTCAYQIQYDLQYFSSLRYYTVELKVASQLCIVVYKIALSTRGFFACNHGSLLKHPHTPYTRYKAHTDPSTHITSDLEFTPEPLGHAVI